MKLWKGVRGDLWNFLTSITLGIVLLALILVLSLIETLIPQSAWTREVDYISRYGIEGYRWIKLLELDNIYGSWYFLFLTVLFFLNLSFNTYVRLRASVRWWRTDFAQTDTTKLTALPLHRRLELTPGGRDLQNTKAQVRSLLRRRFFHVREIPGGVFAGKWKFERFGIDLLHVSLLAVIIALMSTYALGIRTFQVAHKGEVFEIAKGDFSVKVEDFWSENYPKSERVMDWKSRLTILEDGQPVRTQTIEVNKPLIYKGIWIYQAAFGQDWMNFAEVTLRITRASDGANLGEFMAKVDDGFEVPGEKIFIRVEAFLPDLDRAPNGTFYSRTQRLENPAAFVTIVDAQGNSLYPKNCCWAFANGAWKEEWKALSAGLKLPYQIELVGMKAPEFTGLQVNYDPGMPVAYFGFVMMLVGFLTHLFFKHKVIWVRFEPAGLMIGGMARNKSRSFEQEFAGIVGALEVRLNARTSTEAKPKTLETVNI